MADHAYNSGDTALHNAAYQGDVVSVATLLGCGLDVNARNNLGQTPIRMARYFGFTEIVSILEANGAEE